MRSSALKEMAKVYLEWHVGKYGVTPEEALRSPAEESDESDFDVHSSHSSDNSEDDEVVLLYGTSVARQNIAGSKPRETEHVFLSECNRLFLTDEGMYRPCVFKEGSSEELPTARFWNGHKVVHCSRLHCFSAALMDTRVQVFHEGVSEARLGVTGGAANETEDEFCSKVRWFVCMERWHIQTLHRATY